MLEGTVNGATAQVHLRSAASRAQSDDHEFIPRLWATRRVGYLLDEIRLHGENAELRDEVTELARKYGIVTPYTAYLIVEDEERRRVPVAMQTLPQLYSDRVARRGSGGQLGFVQATSGLARRLWPAHATVMRSRTREAPAVAVAVSSVEANRALGVTAIASGTTARLRGLESPARAVFAARTVHRRQELFPEQQSVGGRGCAKVPEREAAAHPVQLR